MDVHVRVASRETRGDDRPRCEGGRRRTWTTWRFPCAVGWVSRHRGGLPRHREKPYPRLSAELAWTDGGGTSSGRGRSTWGQHGRSGVRHVVSMVPLRPGFLPRRTSGTASGVSEAFERSHVSDVSRTRVRDPFLDQTSFSIEKSKTHEYAGPAHLDPESSVRNGPFLLSLFKPHGFPFEPKPASFRNRRVSFSTWSRPPSHPPRRHTHPFPSLPEAKTRIEVPFRPYRAEDRSDVASGWLLPSMGFVGLRSNRRSQFAIAPTRAWHAWRIRTGHGELRTHRMAPGGSARRVGWQAGKQEVERGWNGAWTRRPARARA